jgi:hypothetical protein
MMSDILDHCAEMIDWVEIELTSEGPGRLAELAFR